MKAKKIFSTAALFFFLAAAFLTSFSHASEPGDIKKRMAELKVNIDYLASRHVDTVDYLKQFKAIEKDIAEYENAQAQAEDDGSFVNDDSTKKMIDMSIETLNREVAVKKGAVKRLDILYLVMLVFGAVTGVSFALYIVIMYNKRK